MTATATEVNGSARVGRPEVCDMQTRVFGFTRRCEDLAVAEALATWLCGREARVTWCARHLSEALTMPSGCREHPTDYSDLATVLVTRRLGDRP